MISAHGVSETVTFEAGPDAPDSINVMSTLEALEVFGVELSLPQSKSEGSTAGRCPYNYCESSE